MFFISLSKKTSSLSMNRLTTSNPRTKEYFFDAEHFFDGYRNNPEYAMKVLEVAEKQVRIPLCLPIPMGACFPR